MTALALPDKALATAVQELPDNALAANRQAALARFLERGFPTTRLEDWKYTDLAAIADISQRWLENGAPVPSAAPVSDRVAAIHAAVDIDWIVISNGRITDGMDRAGRDGLSISTFSELAHAPGFEHPLADLNAALLPDGLHIRVHADTTHDRPLGLLIVDGAESQPGVAQARVVIELEEGSQAQFVEYHASLGEADHYANSVVELSLARGASADYVRIQGRDGQHTQTHRTAIALQDSSTVRYSGFDLGGKLVRNDLDIDIAGKEATAIVGGLYIAGEGQHIDNHVRIDHRVGPARSEQEYRGILGGRCRCVWNGKAIVQPGADGTDAEQSNHNLLLSERSEIDAKPELEIYADEVKCSHGTTVGQLDDAALFYLRSRGLDKQDAIRALTRAFGASIVSHSPIAVVTEHLTELVEARLSSLTDGDDE
jgi:Fe-S cluster assembly protein SufD